MDSEAREREPHRWPGDQGSAAKILEGCDIAGDPAFVKAAPIDMRGAWRRVYYCNCWWVVGHHLMYPCRHEREADSVCSKLQAEWEET